MGCLADIARVVDISAKVNMAPLYGTQKGQVLVPTHDWKAFLSPSEQYKTSRNTTTFVFQAKLCL